MKKLQNCSLDHAQIDSLRAFDCFAKSSDLLSAHVNFHNGRVHVTFPANGRCVTKKLRNGAKSCFNVRLSLFLRLGLALRV